VGEAKKNTFAYFRIFTTPFSHTYTHAAPGLETWAEMGAIAFPCPMKTLLQAGVVFLAQ
jgi:hypothetical protein